MSDRDVFDTSRRGLLRAAATAASVSLVPSIGLIGSAFAQSVKPLSFQLSWLKSIQYGGYFAGIEKGFYQEEGLDPTFNSGGPNIDPVGNVASGRSVIGDRPIGPILVARDKGVPIKIVGTVFQKSPFALISLAAKPVKTVKELAGKTVAVSTSNRALVQNLLRDNGVDPKDVTIVPASPDPSALVTGQIDVYTGYSTNQGVMLQVRGHEVFNLHVHDLGLPETAGTIYVREDYLKSNRDDVVRFLRASIKSWQWALGNPEETAKLMVEKYGNPGLDYRAQLTEIKASGEYMTGANAAKQGLLTIDTALYERIIGLYRKVDMVKSNMTVEDLCDPSVALEAHRKT